MGPYVTMVVAIFLIVFTGMTIQSQDKPIPITGWPGATGVATGSGQLNQPITGFCYAPSPAETITFSGPKDEATKCPNGPGGSYKSGGDHRNNFNGNTTYKLIRKNVPLNKEFFTKSDRSDHSTKAVDAGVNVSLDTSKYELYFPQISGEIKVEGNSPYSRTRDCGDRSYENQGNIYFIDYGLAFGLILKDGKPIEVGRYYLTDVFKDTSREELPPIAFEQCANGVPGSAAPVAAPKMQVVIPKQQESTDNAQLQLSYFLFSNGVPSSSSTPQADIVNGWVDTCKPAIYLYPPQKQLVNVKVYPKGFLTYTDPLYDLKNGWTVDAYPDGKISTNYNLQPTTYPYLYYESKIHDEVIDKPTSGWVIESESSVMSQASQEWFNPLESKFQILLPQLGLNSVQTKDFIDYWKKALPYSPYYFIGVVDQANIDQFESLDITPKPDSVNRVRIYFERLDQSKEVLPPLLPTTTYQLQPDKFHVVEWGGMVKNDPDHPFTCSQ